jgi:uncharacterized damage-inducible protein DinB
MSQYGSTELANAFRTVRRNTVQIAEEIPEDKYDFVAAPGARSVSSLFRHIAFATMIYDDMHRDKRITTLKGYDFGAITGRTEAEENKPRSKAEIVQLLKTEGERFACLAGIPVARISRRDVLGSDRNNLENAIRESAWAKEHEMHHRGQLMLIQRMLGITPHLTRQRQERIQQREQARSAVSSATAI